MKVSWYSRKSYKNEKMFIKTCDTKKFFNDKFLPCNRFSVSQNFCSSLKYLSRIKTFEMPNVVDIVMYISKYTQ